LGLTPGGPGRRTIATRTASINVRPRRVGTLHPPTAI
jgi:hypothetical protein